MILVSGQNEAKLQANLGSEHFFFSFKEANFKGAKYINPETSCLKFGSFTVFSTPVVLVVSAQVINSNMLFARTNKSSGEVESPDIRVSAGGGRQKRGFGFGTLEERGCVCVCWRVDEGEGFAKS